MPKDGIYTFSVQADHGAVLKVGDLQLIDSRWYRRFRPFSCRIALRAGLHPIRLEHHYLKDRMNPFLEASLPGDLFHQ